MIKLQVVSHDPADKGKSLPGAVVGGWSDAMSVIALLVERGATVQVSMQVENQEEKVEA